MSKAKVDFWISIVGITLCTARIMIENVQQFETIAALFLFLLNANLVHVFSIYERKISQKTEQKNSQIDDKVMHLEDELRKLNLALNVKGIVRS